MSNMYWLVEKRVLVVKLTEQPGVSDQEKAEYFRSTRDVVAQGISPVYMVIDAREVTALFSPSAAKWTGNNIQQTNQDEGVDSLVWTVIISDNMAVRFIGSLVTQWSGGKLRAVSSMDEALDFLSSRDTSLPSNMKPLLQAVSRR